ncbi:LuxR C-terminal-related transcriptional regulator [Desulfosediminicola flagellatus]|uniref:LuxR C-terminal-related transcriptional regulator n=1 Tax=Desulfosediminicola flagellatus TaxID=2569541 RepID=UPI00142ED98B|nr:LuxR C-terminal-related transcriptional regulator [Desulfosediminicola flagellatus]
MDPLLRTKFHIPLLPPETVIRPRLSNKLSVSNTLSLICAPAGFGKTTLASGWLSHQHAPTAWLSLDENDNDIERFCRYLFTTLDRTRPVVAQKALALLQSTHPKRFTTAITQLINDLEQAGHPLILALDDYHLIDNQEIHAAITFLINHQPQQLHLLIISRAEPPLPIARLRAKNQLGELGADELRFNTEEASTFLNCSMALNLTGEQVAQLDKQTEGWVTGLQLAALSLRELPEATNTFIDNLSGEDRHIADYLLSEVIIHQQQQIQEFLIQTSILKRMNADICDNLLGITNSQQILQQLENDNLFIIPLDNRRCWYRYHHLFAQMLTSHLRNRSKEQVSRLHQHAANWFMTQSMWEEAIDHALEAQDYDQVINHLETNIDQILARGDFNMYLRWLGNVPPDYLPPALTLHQLFFLHEMGEFEAFDLCLQRIEKQLGEPVDGISGKQTVEHGILAAIKGIRCASFFAVDEAWEHFHSALNILSEEQSFWLIMTLGGYGFCNRVRGNYNEAIQIFKHAAAMALRADLPFCFFMDSIALAKLNMEYGHLKHALQTCQTLIDYKATDEGEVPFSGLAHIVMGQLHYHSGELVQSEKHLRHGLNTIVKDGDVFSIVDAYLTLAQCLLNQGKPEQSSEVMDEMSAIIDALEPSQAVTIIAQSCKALIHVLSGRPDLAHRSFLQSDRQYLAGKRYPDLFPLNFQGIYRTSQQSLTYYSNIIHLIAAKLDLEMDRAGDALVLLNELVVQFDEKTSLLFQAEVLIQVALAHRLLGHEKEAYTSLRKAVTLVAPENYCQIFIREGLPVFELLNQMSRQQNSDAPETEQFIARILANISHSNSRGKGKAQHSPFGLTPREVEVLSCLAQGASYAETAEQLFVSINTLKTHTKRIYNKLGVGNRTQAINTAIELNLLPPFSP